MADITSNNLEDMESKNEFLFSLLKHPMFADLQVIYTIKTILISKL